MRRASWLSCLLGVLLGAAVPGLSQDVAILPGSGPTITIPSMTFDLMTSTFVFCGLEPSSLVNYTTRWVLPGGEIVDSTASNGRFIVSENRVLIDGTPLPGTLLTVPSVSYVDAGTYTCEGRSTNPGASTLWASASIEIQLKLELSSNMSTVNATMNDTTVVLECEMRAYIRPDSFLVWEGPGGRTITGGTGKHQITFSNGSPNAAANGSSLLVPSRVSTLTISAPEPSDAGTYTCRVTGVENPVVAIDLLVDGLRGIETTDTISTMAADVDTTRLDAQAPTSTTANNQVFQVIGAVLGSVAVVILILAGLLAVVVCRVFRTQRKSRTEVHIVSSNKGAGVQQPVYDYIDLPELKLDDTIDRRYSGVPHQAKRNDRDYYEIKDDPNADIYDEIRDNRERDDDTYETIKIVNTAETNRNDLEKSGVYDVPIGGHGTLVAGNDVFGVTRDEVDIAHNIMERNKIDGGAISQNDYDYADIDTMVDSDVIGVTNGSMQ